MLEQHRQPFAVGTARDVYMSYSDCCHEAAMDKYIKIRIQNFEGYEHMDSEASQIVILRYYDHRTELDVPDEYYAITQDSLPSANDIIRCCPDPIHSCNMGPFAALHKAFSEFGELYCKVTLKMPLVSIVRFLSYSHSLKFETEGPSAEIATDEMPALCVYTSSGRF